MSRIPAPVRALPAAPNPAHLATVLPDGAPHSSRDDPTNSATSAGTSWSD